MGKACWWGGIGGGGRYFLLSANFVVAFAFVFCFAGLWTLGLGISEAAMVMLSPSCINVSSSMLVVYSCAIGMFVSSRTAVVVIGEVARGELSSSSGMGEAAFGEAALREGETGQ